ncbi:hypothetical protein [Kutzneria buriramensis]|uniref:Lamin tail-like protein n=1 Tax=Kutzneria buriramensis TaxID=1045776 RepID=A0A3E0HL37_9PSEU|nr:hypothetical protein [Kutzneria buriramensis]REH47202.1 hypothetical protein BCF44_106367 [Kutzneria buriramensis]
MRRSFTALVTAGIAALSLLTGTAAASATPHSATAAQMSCTVVIDQFATRGPAGQNDQYIQLKNIGIGSLSLGDFRVMADTGASTPPFVLATIPMGTILLPGRPYLIANAGYSGPLPDQFWSGITLPDRVGVGLVSPPGTTVDAAATIASSMFVRGAAASPQPPNTQPLANMRLTNTGNNAVDFSILTRTPGVPGPVGSC